MEVSISAPLPILEKFFIAYPLVIVVSVIECTFSRDNESKINYWNDYNFIVYSTKLRID